MSRLFAITALLFLAGGPVLGESNPPASRERMPLPAEQLLPAETVVMFTAPDFIKARELFNQTTLAAVWNDESLKPFRDKFFLNLQEELLSPLKRELKFDLLSYAELFRGQVTFALIREPSREGEHALRPVFLADTAEKSGTLKTNLASLRNVWTAAGKVVRSEKIRSVDFIVTGVSTNDIPPALRKFFPRVLDFEELGAEGRPHKADGTADLFIGQAGSLLIATTSARVAEKLLIRLEGGVMPALGDLAGFQASYTSTLRGAPAFGWLNAKSLVGSIVEANPVPTSEAPSPVDVIRPGTFLRASGLGDLSSVAFTCRQTREGTHLQLALNVAECDRKGLFKILTAQSRETTPPPFIPADVTRFRRWRLDGKKTWSTLETMMAEVSPQWISAIQFLLTTANDAAKLKDPGFDIKSNLFGNLGEDWMIYEKAPRGTSPAQMSSPPSIWLVGSPNPEQLTASLKSVLIFMSAQAETPAEREFLGRKIFSVPLPYVPMPLGDSPAANTTATLHYAATSGYVALSTDITLLEEFLRSPETQARPLRELPGFSEAAQRVLGPNTIMFAFHNQLETARHDFAALQANRGSMTNAPAPFRTLSGVFGIAGPEQSFGQFMDFSLLPSFGRIARHFHITVQSANTTVDGITFSYFAPLPSGGATLAADRP